MSAIVTTPLLDEPELNNLAELVDRLGGIPLERVRLHPPPGTATEADVLRALEAPCKRICELIDGVLVEKSMGYSESVLASVVIEFLNAFVRSHNLGLVTAPDGTVRLWAGRVRIPDVAFFSWERLPGRKRPTDPIPTLSPDLVIEILSRGNTPSEMRSKREDYFSVGVRLVWEIDPQTRTIHVYSTAGPADAVLTEADVLDGGTVLSGFELPLGELFAELERQG